MTVPFTSVHIQIVHNLYKVNPPILLIDGAKIVYDNMNMVDSSS